MKVNDVSLARHMYLQVEDVWDLVNASISGKFRVQLSRATLAHLQVVMVVLMEARVMSVCRFRLANRKGCVLH